MRPPAECRRMFTDSSTGGGGLAVRSRIFHKAFDHTGEGRAGSQVTFEEEPWRARVGSVPLSGERRIDALLAGPSWADRPGEPIVLSYAFAETADSYPRPYSAFDEPSHGFAPLSPVQRAAVREALELWAAVADIRFVESDERSGPADLRFAATDATRTAHAYYPGTSPAAGDVWLSTSLPTEIGYEAGSYEFFVLLHEIGHALGLKHPHEPEISRVVLGRAEDHLGFTLMSYRAFPGASVSHPFEGADFPRTPMLGDIGAIQYLYGAAGSTAADDTVYRFEAGRAIWRTIYDTGGVDTLDLSELIDGVRLDLRPGGLSAVGPPADTGGPPQKLTLAIAPGTVIENVIGTDRADRIVGNTAGNRLEGRGGDDRLDGGAGDDVLLPGAGDDRVVGGPGLDRVVLDGPTTAFAVRVKGAKLVIRDVRTGAPEGRDRLESIEYLEFSDGIVSVPERVPFKGAVLGVDLAALVPDDPSAAAAAFG